MQTLPHAIDQVDLRFDDAGLLALNVVLGLVMFGVALDLRVADFRRVIARPRAPVVGLIAQFVLLPAATYGLTLLLKPPPSIALGMILVAACPGGNVSNFVTHLAGGATAVSVSMTAVSTLAAVVMTPLNLALWGGMRPGTAAILRSVELDPIAMLGTVALILAAPLAAGMTTAARWPALAARMQRPFKAASVAFFAIFVVVAFHKNFDHFLASIGFVFVPVLVHNSAAIALGWTLSTATRLHPAERRAVAVEVGIQNSGLGLVLIFSYFAGLGGMAVVAAWWGIWHVIIGLSVAALWSRRPIPVHAGPMDAPVPMHTGPTHTGPTQTGPTQAGGSNGDQSR